MTKYSTDKEKIEAWMKKKNEWALQLISSYQEGTPFSIVVEKSRQMQTNVTRVQRKLKHNQELLTTDYEFTSDRAKTISNYYSNCNRHVRKLISNQTTLSRTYQRGRIIEISSMIESLFFNKLQLRKFKLTLSQSIKLYETVIIREYGLKLSTAKEIVSSLDFENKTINQALHYIKKDFIPIRNLLAHKSDDEPWNITFSDFEYYSNQGLIGYQMLLEHVERQLAYYTGIFHQHVIKSLELNKEIYEYYV